MGQFRRRMFDECSEEVTSDERYNMAYKKVKRIKGFYSHLRIYLIINVIIIISNLNRDFFVRAESHGLFDWHTYSTAVFWGIGLLAHGLSVYGRDIFFSDDWEEKKIQKFMEKDSSKNKWQ